MLHGRTKGMYATGMKQRDVMLMQLAKVAGGMVIFVILTMVRDDFKSEWSKALVYAGGFCAIYFVFCIIISIYKSNKGKSR